jgi:hypothetical protein
VPPRSAGNGGGSGVVDVVDVGVAVEVDVAAPDEVVEVVGVVGVSGPW